MNWLKNLFAKPDNKPAAAPLMKSLRPSRDIPIQEAKRISTENVREWCAKLEAEGERTGNQRLLAQARNIRARLT